MSTRSSYMRSTPNSSAAAGMVCESSNRMSRRILPGCGGLLRTLSTLARSSSGVSTWIHSHISLPSSGGGRPPPNHTCCRPRSRKSTAKLKDGSMAEPLTRSPTSGWMRTPAMRRSLGWSGLFRQRVGEFKVDLVVLTPIGLGGVPLDALSEIPGPPQEATRQRRRPHGGARDFKFMRNQLARTVEPGLPPREVIAEWNAIPRSPTTFRLVQRTRRDSRAARGGCAV